MRSGLCLRGRRRRPAVRRCWNSTQWSLQTPCCGGIGDWSIRSRTSCTARSGSATDHARDFAADRPHGTGEPWLGLHTDLRSAFQSQSPSGPRHGRQCAERSRHRAITRTQQANCTVNVSAGALESAMCRGFSDRRSLDGEGVGDALPAFVMSLTDRIVAIDGITTRPDEAWMLQVGRNLTDCETSALRSMQ